jgi:asparagine synthase (glutamine-hydrolysing)
MVLNRVELAATIPADIKFRNGKMKHLLLELLNPVLPPSILERKDKMGFPVPLNDWLTGALKSYLNDLLSSQKALQREFIDNSTVLKGLTGQTAFSRDLWGFVSLELWQTIYADTFNTHKQEGVRLGFN